MSRPLALFDLDGTLVDSAPDLADAVDSALVTAGIAPLGEALVRSFIGNGAASLIHRAITGDFIGVAPQPLFDAVYARFLDAYQTRLFVRTRLYPGVRETLSILAQAGWLLGCVTNKPARFATPLLVEAGLAAYFALTLSGDSLPRKKPDPDQILHAAATLGAALGQVVMIGDSITDLTAARNAGVRSVCVRYGYHAGIDLAAHGADHLIDHLAELPSLLTPRFISSAPPVD